MGCDGMTYADDLREEGSAGMRELWCLLGAVTYSSDSSCMVRPGREGGRAGREDQSPLPHKTASSGMFTLSPDAESNHTSGVPSLIVHKGKGTAPHHPLHPAPITMDTFAPPTAKKRRNAHGLQLSSRALAPLPPTIHPSSSSSSSHHPGMIHDALSEFINMNQATPTVASARRQGGGGEDERAAVTPTQASHHGLLPPAGGGGKSSISRKKPADLDISTSLAPEGIRRAPGFPDDDDKRRTTKGAARELESTLAAMEIATGSTLDAAPPRTKSSSSSTKTRKPGSSSGRGKQAPSSSSSSSLDSGPFGELKNDEFKVVQDLGAGAGGTVDKVIHVPTGTIMAKKVSPPPPFAPAFPLSIGIHRSRIAQLVLIDAKPAVRKQILRELQIMHGCASPYIVSFYGAFMREPHICICMEYMDRT